MNAATASMSSSRERRHLDMAPGGVKSLDRTADRGEIAADPVVVFLRRTLQVDVRRVDERRQLLDDRRLGAAVGDEDVEHPPGAHLARAVAHELPSDQRLVVGVGKEMESFWQNGHLRLHPKLPTESTFSPGWKNAIGFFSIGSSAIEVTLP